MKQGIFLALLLGLCLRAGSLGAQDVCGHDGRQIRAILENIRSEYAPDKRVAVFEIAAGDTADGRMYTLRGKCDDTAAVRALTRRLEQEGITCRIRIRTLPDEALGEHVRALVTLSSVNLRTAPAHAAEMGTQAVLGTPLRVLEREGSWFRVQTPDRYICWVDSPAIALRSEEQMGRWRKSARYIYTTHLGFVRTEPNERSPVLSDIVLGSIVEADARPEHKPGWKYVAVRLPDGRKGYVRRTEVRPLDEWAALATTPDGLERTARSMTGVPYLWGGTSVKGVDCSGMVKTAYWANGTIIARDASQQALTGESIVPEAWRTCRKGDLLFFGNAATGRVTHVGMYLSEGRFIHSSGRVRINSLDPAADDYVGYDCIAIRRILTRLGTPGIVRAAEHPWYFDR
ncbi:C40 family peptidase [uncultured Alistipes sp.]|uniref:C40 family peptidase n=1 Tax=uncultured Alistipes sp. TaxID=538949 RepID=UPI002626632D|nr:C40 family peptidase [uncultured Alistipes sp.]